MKSTFLRTALILGLLSTIGPFAIDMYLPGLPSIARDLHASTVQVQLSLVAFIVAAALSQLIYGPASDILGRKRPIGFGLSLFAAASVCCTLAPGIETLVIFRIFQGIGACATMVLTRAIVRDLYTGKDAVRMMGLLIGALIRLARYSSSRRGSGLVQQWGAHHEPGRRHLDSCGCKALASRITLERSNAYRGSGGNRREER